MYVKKLLIFYGLCPFYKTSLHALFLNNFICLSNCINNKKKYFEKTVK